MKDIEFYEALASSCKCSECPNKPKLSYQYVSGCLPWDCIYTTKRQAMTKEYSERARGMCSTLAQCPLASATDFKGGLLGCPKFIAKEEMGPVCPYGVRGIVVQEPESRLMRTQCLKCSRYEFDPRADLRPDSHLYVVKGTPVEKECKRLGVKNVRIFSKLFSPEEILGVRGLRSEHFNRILKRMEVYGYEYDGPKWCKRSVNEQNDWAGELQFAKTKAVRLIEKKRRDAFTHPVTETEEEQGE